MLPPADLDIVLALHGTGRSAELTPSSPKGEKIAAHVAQWQRAS